VAPRDDARHVWSVHGLCVAQDGELDFFRDDAFGRTLAWQE
jgi:hypothetical protein